MRLCFRLGLGSLVTLKGNFHASAQQDILDNSELSLFWEQFGEDPFSFSVPAGMSPSAQSKVKVPKLFFGHKILWKSFQEEWKQLQLQRGNQLHINVYAFGMGWSGVPILLSIQCISVKGQHEGVYMIQLTNLFLQLRCVSYWFHRASSFSCIQQFLDNGIDLYFGLGVDMFL